MYLTNKLNSDLHKNEVIRIKIFLFYELFSSRPSSRSPLEREKFTTPSIMRTLLQYGFQYTTKIVYISNERNNISINKRDTVFVDKYAFGTFTCTLHKKLFQSVNGSI